MLWLLGRVRRRPISRRDFTPTVDFLIGAYNEEAVLGDKLENCLGLDYPPDKLQIIVASDASTDGTNNIARKYERSGVRLVVAPLRRGKAANFREVVPTLTGEILLFSDAGSLYRPETLRKMMRNFGDPEVGCVGGKVRYVNPSATSVSQGEGLYWSYEAFLRKAESDIGSTVVLSGAVYAIRGELSRPVADPLPDDFMTPLNVLDQGRRVIFETDTEILEKAATSVRSEMETKIRIVARNFSALRSMKRLLHPRRHPLLSLQLLSHRLLRWFVLQVALLMFGANALLVSHPFYGALFLGQILFYLLAGIGCLLDLSGRHSRVATVPFYFVLVNLSAALAIWRHLTGQGVGGVWEPVER